MAGVVIEGVLAQNTVASLVNRNQPHDSDVQLSGVPERRGILQRCEQNDGRANCAPDYLTVAFGFVPPLSPSQAVKSRRSRPWPCSLSDTRMRLRRR